MTALTLAAGAIPVAHAAPATPFTQCPAVNDSPSCQVLLTVASDGSIIKAVDSSVGPIDREWNDGSMIGIKNTSSSVVHSILLTGWDVNDFDSGGGMCYFIDCTWSAPNAFEGPNTQYVSVPGSIFDKLEVRFPNGLAPGQSTFFSLRQVPETATVLSASMPTKTYKYLVQVDRYNPVVKGNAKATSYLKKLVASLDDDGVLKHREDVGICGPSATCLRYRTQAQFVNVTLVGTSAPSKAQIIAAVNRATTKNIGDVTTTNKLSKVTGPVTVAWVLDTAHGASPMRPWGPKYNLQQTFLGRS